MYMYKASRQHEATTFHRMDGAQNDAVFPFCWTYLYIYRKVNISLIWFCHMLPITLHGQWQKTNRAYSFQSSIKSRSTERMINSVPVNTFFHLSCRSLKSYHQPLAAFLARSVSLGRWTCLARFAIAKQHHESKQQNRFLGFCNIVH